MSLDNDLAQEQEYLDELYRLLEELRAGIVARLRQSLRAASDTPQELSERESYNRMYTSDLTQIDAAAAQLYFGRIDMEDGETRRIGRMGLLDADDDYAVRLIDWRAPLSRPFYLATTAHPDGVSRRRHIRSNGIAIASVHDEHLAASAATLPETAAEGTDGDGVAGEEALLYALNRARTEHMEDIVSTIQREQDAIIRSEHRGVTVVQGGPGTGKTAVALHRAAYLLYTYRKQLERAGVLIIGPNSTFLNYISRVLPSLGETGVVLRTLETLFPGIEATGTDTLHAEEVKGSELMTEILQAAVAAYQTVPTEPLELTVDGGSILVSPQVIRRARGRARSSRRQHNRAQPLFAAKLLDEVTDLAIAAVGHDDSGMQLYTEDDREEIRQELGEHPALLALIEAHWPTLSAPQVVADLLSSPQRLAAAAGDLIEQDRNALFRPAGSEFSPADVPLIDEVAELIGTHPDDDDTAAETRWRAQVQQAQDALDILTGSANMEFEDEGDSEILAAYDLVSAEQLAERQQNRQHLTAAERAARDRTWTYGHVIVDEAQELSAMAWRAIMRRVPNRWITAVGDTAQTGNPAGVDNWADAFTPFVAQRWRLHELTVNYRTPQAIMDVAAVVLREIDPARNTAQSLRSGTPRPELLEFDDTATEQAIGAVSHWISSREAERSAAIIVPSPADRLALTGRGLPPNARVLTLDAAKGLEFDYVVLWDPGALVRRSPQGLQDLYVALTRATQEVLIAAGTALPGPLRSARTEGLLRPRSLADLARA